MGQVVRETTPHDPDDRGHWGAFGGRFVPEALMAVIDEVTDAYGKARLDEGYLAELDSLQRHYSGRPSPLYEAERFGAEIGARVFLKREDLNHTGSHKINNVLGQALLAQRMGKQRVIAETGAGQHGVATATACALLGLDCKIYMGAVDVERQALNVARMRLLGAEVESVEIGSRTLKDAINEAMRDWVAHADDTYYAFGTAAGPHPFPTMVRDFQRVVGAEARAQILDRIGRLPDAAVACVGGGSNAIGLFHPFIDDTSVRLVGCEAGGDGVGTGRTAAGSVRQETSERLPIWRNFWRRALRIASGFMPSNSSSISPIASPTRRIASSRSRCAPPRGSGITRSMTPSAKRSPAVRRSASAASRIFSASFHRIEAQPSGEITE